MLALDDLRTDLDVDPDDDQAQVITAAREQARAYLRTTTSFAWNATNLSAPLRSQLLGLFRGYRARTHIVYCEATASEQHERNRARSAPVPAAVIDRMPGRWTPDPTEAHAVTHVVPADPRTRHHRTPARWLRRLKATAEREATAARGGAPQHGAR